MTERRRELVIMRVAALRRSTYEWAQHLFVARAIKDTIWAALAEHLNSQAIPDVILTAGSYAMVASMLDSLGIELDNDLCSGVAALTDPSTAIGG
nr:hypothetical protein [Mycolicibacterium xanthum]